MPSSPNFARSNFTLIRTVGTTISPFTGKTKTQEYDGAYWLAEVSLPPMKRTDVANWQAFLAELNGPTNYFKFADPSALTNTGTYSTSYLLADKRVNVASATLTFNNSTSVISGASSTNYFSGLRVGDFIHITGATNEDNNGTHKITTYTNAYTITVDSTLVTEASTASCKIRQNIKGVTGLSLEASTNSATGTIKKGDYLQVQAAASTSTDPAQLLLVTEDATVTTDSGKDFISVKTQPKLRQDLTDGHYVVFTNPKGKFRLMVNEIDWSSNTSLFYGLGFSCIEVVQMATRGGLDTAIVNRLGADHQELFFAIKAEFDTSTIRLWTGTDDLTIGGATYTGAGSLLDISDVEETQELKSSGLSITLSGMDQTVLDYALAENYQNRPITLYLGYLSGSTNETVGTLTLFKGRMISMTVNDTPDGANINLDCENRLVDLNRPSNFRYTKDSQEFLHTGDKGFDRVASLQDKEIIWGQKSEESINRSADNRNDYRDNYNAR